MATALDLARLGLGRTSPNPVVGAVIVKKGKILATGFHRRVGLPHAEIEAMTSPVRLSAATLSSAKQPPFGVIRRGAGGEVFRGATMYVTLEPCCHHGRTPPCTDAIIRSGIKEVVVGMRDPDPKVAGRGIRILKAAGIKVRVGVLEKECRELNKAYIKHRTKGLPFVTLKAAMTADGKVGLKTGRPYKITGAEAQEQSHLLRDQSDAILVGSGTVFSDNPRLTTRLKGHRGKDPIRIVLEGRRRVPSSARIFKIKSKSPTWRLDGLVDLQDLLRELGRRGIVSLLVEGGPKVWSSFLRQGLVDRVVLFIAPTTLGPKGIPLLEDIPARRTRFKETSQRVLGCDIMVEGSF